MKRPHNFQFGADIKRNQSNLFSQQDTRGNFGFNGAATQMTVNGVPVAGTGSDFADFLLGIPDTSSIAFGNADKYFRSTNYDLYFNDDWRVNASLTINGGVRWDYGSPITELYGRLVNLDVFPGFSAETPVLGSNPTGALTGLRYPNSLVHPDKAGFQPRIGISRTDLRQFAGDSRGRGHFNTSVYSDYQPDGAAIAAFKPERAEYAAQPADAGEWLQRNAGNYAHPSRWIRISASATCRTGRPACSGTCRRR